MKVVPPYSPIDLTIPEQTLYAQLPTEGELVDPRSRGIGQKAGSAMAELMKSLQGRDAIPELRQSVFADPVYAETGKRSPMQVFESNGTRDQDIFRHSHFLPYLRYFVEGPALPRAVMSKLCELLADEMGPSNRFRAECRAYARDLQRRHHRELRELRTQFYRLALELGLQPNEARMIRETLKQAR